jgi:peptidoglycan L-alanyl-D-glutamate endopeptidase CwlK
MPAFGATSLSRLQTCHPDLIRLFAEVVRVYDCTVLEGHRTEARQAQLVKSGASKTHDSKHLAYPSLAVDVAPFPIEWPDQLTQKREMNAQRVRQSWVRWGIFAGIVFATAERMGIKVRWGGSWDGDMDPRGNRFEDYPHWELVT